MSTLLGKSLDHQNFGYRGENGAVQKQKENVLDFDDGEEVTPGASGDLRDCKSDAAVVVVLDANDF